MDHLDTVLDELAAGEKAWASATLADRRRLLERVHQATAAAAGDWVRAAAAYKRLPDGSQLLGEEWLSGPYGVLTAVAALIRTVSAVEAGRSPVDGYPLGTAPGGRVTVKVLPHDMFDRLLLSGFTAEVWMRTGVDATRMRAEAGLGLKHPGDTGGIGVVLGAGNITSIPILDVLYELYANNRVVVLKLNPITDGMLDAFTAALKPLIDLGAVRIVTGGADVGGYLVHHPMVAHVHMTGSALTHDAIVWGTGPEAAERKQAGTPLLDKPVTSELGGVSPVIVVPGRWSDADLRFQAEHVATQRLQNGGYNCIATQDVIVSSDWPQKDAFLAQLRAVFAQAPARPAYYPGSDEREARARAEYPDSEMIGDRLLIPDVGQNPDALTTEYFAPVLGVLELPGEGTNFLSAAVEAANDRFAGTLGVNLIADPRTISALGPALDEAIAALRYGTVAVNCWTAVGFLTAPATWGAYPGHTLAEVGSGVGVVHNSLLLSRPERTVVRGPFRPAPRSVIGGEMSLSPRPPWFVTSKTAATTGRLLAEFAARPRWSALPAIVLSAMRG
ncbi:MAG TPA: aldehyde dehydrogenase family protein [Streptosporangiaceae bacterium]|nr:aldehyde dehydrogenase family protein [Streptosporangiaceae bacterium]